MGVRVEVRGDFSKTTAFLNKAKRGDALAILNKYGQQGVSALASATPVESGQTAASWSYKVQKTSRGYSVEWFNAHVEGGANIAVLLQYGHGTGTGGYVHGRDYINPAMRPIFDSIAHEAWKAVISGA